MYMFTSTHEPPVIEPSTLIIGICEVGILDEIQLYTYNKYYNNDYYGLSYILCIKSMQSNICDNIFFKHLW